MLGVFKPTKLFEPIHGEVQSRIGIIESAIEISLDAATDMGAYLRRLEYMDSNITTMNENVQSFESAIRDADIAKEMTDYPCD